jgi:hypothetical protein
LCNRLASEIVEQLANEFLSRELITNVREALK